jgi:hypothetical protein
MDKGEKRELTQLFKAANYYLKLAEEAKKKLEDCDLELTISEWTKEFSDKSNANYNIDIFHMTAHLASAAMRLETIESIIKSRRYKNYKDLQRLEEPSNLEHLYSKIKGDIIHLLLRHKIGHKERKANDRVSYGFLMKKYFELKIIELYRGIESAIKVISDELSRM